MNAPQPVLRRLETHKQDQKLVGPEGEINVGGLEGRFQRSLRKSHLG